MAVVCQARGQIYIKKNLKCKVTKNTSKKCNKVLQQLKVTIVNFKKIAVKYCSVIKKINLKQFLNLYS